ncbi:hypothetical protein BBF96_05735 [Anoxybacter fermentans]|uniref:Uncharacterized protein n=1 Tax=Anoxybacter fermentans TaxID=1323375 RepID=A0A3Q9HQ74_9FIRM|nr:hypothetical protein [Anoxybacter fermentans]AZR72936.1 hypothetical protein BBF96_05735 [Anoxybacter fermentans]
MMPDLKTILLGLVILLIAGLLYLLRRQLMLLAINRGILIIQKLILKILTTLGDYKAPKWVLVEYPSKGIFTLGILSQTGKTRSTIYIPSGPRLIPGQTVFLDNNNWHHLDLDFEEGLRIIITLGLDPGTGKISHKIWNRMEDFQS